MPQKLFETLRYAVEDTSDYIQAALQRWLRVKTPPRKSLDLARLEDRVMLSASPAGAALEEPPADDPQPEEGAQLSAAPDDSPTAQVYGDAHESAAAQYDQAQQSRVRELVIIDPAARDYEQLIADLSASIDDGREMEFLVLDADGDGVRQISEALTTYSGLDSLHIVSHGANGSIFLGNAVLSLDNLQGYKGEIAQWRDALSVEADILLYGCDLASDASGQTLVDSLGVLTGADIAASSDATGHALLGGDWELEYQTGLVETAIAFSEAGQEQWFQILAPVWITGRETVDADANGQIDHILITTRRDLNDNFSGLTMTVSGFALDPTTPYLTNLGAGGNNDRVFYIKLVESGSPDTGVTPAVTLVSNTTLGNGGNLLTSFGTASTDSAAPVLLSATANQLGGSSLFNTVGQQVDFVFSETLAGAPSEFNLESAITFAGGAFDGDNLPSIGTGANPYGLATTNSINDTLRVALNTNNVANVNLLSVGSHTAQVTSGANLLDLAGNQANVLASSVVIQGSTPPPPNVGPINSVPAAQATGEDVGLTFSAGGGNAISVSDADAGLNPIQVTLTGGNGTVTLSSLSGLTFSVGSGVNDATMTFTGTMADINTALDGLVFNPTTDFSGAATLRIVTDDLGNTGFGGALTDDDTISIAVSAANDPPQNNVPGAQSTTENFGLTFSAPRGNLISVSDVDAGSGALEVTLNATNGTVTLSGTSNLTFSSGDGASDTTMTFSGASSDINAALDGLVFDPTPSFLGAASLQIITNDQGNTGPGGPLSDDDTISITVSAAAGAPLAYDDAYSVDEDGFLSVDVLMGPITTTTEPYSTNILAVGEDVYIDRTYVFTSVPTQYDGLWYIQTANDDKYVTDPNHLNFTLTADSTVFVAFDVRATILPAWLGDGTWTVTADILSTTDIGETDRLVYRKDYVAGSVTLGGNATPPEAGAESNYSVFVAPITPGLGVLGNDSDPEGDYITASLVSGPSNGVLVFSADGSFEYTPDPDFFGTDTFTYRAYDGTDYSNTAVVTITVNPVNDGPSVSAPGAQVTDEDTGLTFSAVAGNLISIADPDAGGNPVQVTLTAADGSVTLNGITGLTFSVGDGVGDPTMTFSGTVADINSALDGLTFDPAADFNGSTSLQIDMDDLGSTGGGSLTATDTVTITVNAINDAPTNVVPASQTMDEDTTLVFSSAGGNQIAVADDAGNNPIEVTLNAASGLMTLNGVAGLTFTTGDGTSDASMTFTGTIANINAALDGLQFDPPPEFSGATSIQIITNDLGNSGAGGPLTDSDTVAVTVNAVNDAPANSGPGPQSTNEDTPLAFSTAGGNAISISDMDAGTNAVQVTLNAANGAITLSGTSGLAFSTGDGTNDATMTFTGAMTDINAALDGLVFDPTSDFSGAGSLQIITNDLGNTGSGGALSDSDTFAITIDPVNDAPLNSVPGPQSAIEDTPLVFSAGSGNLISISDDAGSNPVQVTLNATNGLLTLNGVAGLTFSTGDGASDSTMTFTGTLADINAALDGLVFDPATGFV